MRPLESRAVYSIHDLSSDHSEAGAFALDADWISQLQRAAADSPTGRTRVCLHRDHASPIQEMLIAFAPGADVAAHRHPGRVESLTAIAGRATIDLFSPPGESLGSIELAPATDGGTFTVRFDGDGWHAVRPHECGFVVHEVAEGPFDPEATEWLADHRDGNAPR